MGALAELGDDAPIDDLRGDGKRLVEWWRQADEEDRALLRAWLKPQPSPTHRSHADIADRLTATGYPIGASTITRGARLLRRLPEWES